MKQYFSAFIKPASSLCNLKCEYCFYYDEASKRKISSYGNMTKETAKCLIDKVFSYVRPPAQISFSFQGGEPTLVGLDYYHFFCDYAKANASIGMQISFSIQTNGTNLNEEWCQMLKKYNFLVGISLDGTREIHDIYRRDKNSQSTFSHVLKAIRLMNQYNIQYNVVTVVTNILARHPQKVFSFYQKQKFKYIQLIPCLAPLYEDSSIYRPSPRSYAEFQKRFFDLWYFELLKGNYISVRLYDNLIARLRGKHFEECGMYGKCTPQFVVESDGSIYPCDFYALDQFYSGNIHVNQIDEILNSSGTALFLGQQEPTSELCKTCAVANFCNGGCKRYRSFYQSEQNFCPLQEFYIYALPILQKYLNTQSLKSY